MQRIRIDFVSDVVCPWCVIGLRSLEQALERLAGEIEADITLHPFELNPDMGPGGENIVEHLDRKYGPRPGGSMRETIRQRAAELGFAMETDDESRIYNTFDAHRLLAWAKDEGRQLALKHALFEAYFTAQKDVSDHAVLLDAAEAAGLPRERGAEILASGDYGDQVRAEATLWRSRGINAVPAAVVDQKYLISGGQPSDVFENALRNIAAQQQAGG